MRVVLGGDGAGRVARLSGVMQAELPNLSLRMFHATNVPSGHVNLWHTRFKKVKSESSLGVKCVCVCV